MKCRGRRVAYIAELDRLQCERIAGRGDSALWLPVTKCLQPGERCLLAVDRVGRHESVDNERAVFRSLNCEVSAS